MLVADIFSMYFFSIFSSWVSFAHDGKGYKNAVINKMIVPDGHQQKKVVCTLMHLEHSMHPKSRMHRT